MNSLRTPLSGMFVDFISCSVVHEVSYVGIAHHPSRLFPIGHQPRGISDAFTRFPGDVFDVSIISMDVFLVRPSKFCAVVVDHPERDSSCMRAKYDTLVIHVGRSIIILWETQRGGLKISSGIRVAGELRLRDLSSSPCFGNRIGLSIAHDLRQFRSLRAGFESLTNYS